MGVAIVAGCVAMVVLAVVWAVRWGSLPVVEVAVPAGRGTAAFVLRRYVRSVALAIVAGAGAGLLVAGAGGRLAMRLLAVTAGDSSQGLITEADQVVGEISLGGTLGLLVFAGIGFGAVTGFLYMILRRWLPQGRLGGLLFGVILLVIAAPLVDPIRRDNADFDLVGPGWVALLVFATLTLLQGLTVAAIAGRYSQRLPLIEWSPRTLLRYVPLLLLVPLPIALIPVAVVGLVVVLVGMSPKLMAWFGGRGVTVAGRVVLVAVVVVFTPLFVSTLADSAARGPA